VLKIDDQLPLHLAPERYAHERCWISGGGHRSVGLTPGISRSGAHSDTRRCRLHAVLAGPGRPQPNAVVYLCKEALPHGRQQLS
jgi:hypothetical protein